MQREIRAGEKDSNSLFFEVILNKKPDEKLGIETVLVKAPIGYGLVIQRVLPQGAVDSWNKKSYEPVRVRTGDFVIVVNGIEGNEAELYHALKTGSVESMRIQRSLSGGDPAKPLFNPPPGSVTNGAVERKGNAAFDMTRMFRFEVSLRKKEGVPLGIDVCREVQQPTLPGLIVKRISGGVVGKHNSACRVPFDIRVGDCIVGVNSVFTDLQGMMQELKSCSDLLLALVRASEPISSKLSFTPACSAREEEFVEDGSQSPAGEGERMDGEGGSDGSNVNADGLAGSHLRQDDGKNINVRDILAGMGTRGAAAAEEPALLESVNTLMETIENSIYKVSGSEQPDQCVKDRFVKFDVILKPRTDMRLGLDFVMLVMGGQCCCVVCKVMDGGILEKWNQHKETRYRVIPGDYILGINDIKIWHDPAKIVQAFGETDQPLRLHIQRGIGSQSIERRVTGPIRQPGSNMESKPQQPELIVHVQDQALVTQSGQASQSEKDSTRMTIPEPEMQMTPQMVQRLAASLTEPKGNSPARPGSQDGGFVAPAQRIGLHDPLNSLPQDLLPLTVAKKPEPKMTSWLPPLQESPDGDGTSDASQSRDAESGSGDHEASGKKTASAAGVDSQLLQGELSTSPAANTAAAPVRTGPASAPQKMPPDPAEIAAMLTGKSVTRPEDTKPTLSDAETPSNDQDSYLSSVLTSPATSFPTSVQTSRASVATSRTLSRTPKPGGWKPTLGRTSSLGPLKSTALQ